MGQAVPHSDGESEIEIRQVFESEEFGAELRPNCASRRTGCERRSRTDQ